MSGAQDIPVGAFAYRVDTSTAMEPRAMARIFRKAAVSGATTISIEIDAKSAIGTAALLDVQADALIAKAELVAGIAAMEERARAARAADRGWWMVSCAMAVTVNDFAAALGVV